MHVIFGCLLLTTSSCIVVERRHVTEEYRNIQVGSIFVCWIIVSRSSAIIEYFSFLAQSDNHEACQGGLRVSTKWCLSEEGRLVFDFDDCVSVVDDEKDFFLRRNVDAWVVMVRDAKSTCYWSLLAHSHNEREHALVLDHYLYNYIESFVRGSKNGSQEIWEHPIFHNVLQVQVKNACGILASGHSLIAQPTLHRLCKFLFWSHGRSRHNHYLVWIYWLGWQNELAINPKLLAHMQWFRSPFHDILRP